MSNDGGDFISGTVADKAFFDAILDTVDDQAHSTTNPTIKPKATTDEVVTARGSKASLDARLDIALNEDGTLKSQASLVTAAQVQSALGSRNVANNGDLADWTLGGALAPDNFTLTGAAATIARTGPAMGDTFTFGTGGGGFAAKITRVGNDWKLTQDVIAAADFAKFVNVKGQKVSVAVKGKTAIASLLRIVVDDGVSTTASTYHTGGGTEEHLSITHTISLSATKVSVYVEGTGSNGDAYVGGFMVVFADLAPSDWSPLSAIGDVSATSKGLVNLFDQVMGAGVKTFPKPPIFPPGTSAAADAIVSGRVSSNTTAVGNIGGGTDPLMSDNVKANWLSADGKAYRYSARGIGANNANAKTITAVFDGNTVFNSSSFTTEWVNGWELDVLIVRTSATTCKVYARFSCASTTGTRGNYNSVTVANWTADRTLQINGAGVADNDIVQHIGVGEVLG